MEEKIEEILATVKATDKKLDVLTSKVERLETKDREKDITINEMKEENNTLRIRLESMEQYSRRNNLIVSGIPQREKENVRELVTNLASKWGINIPTSGIVAAHRLFSKSGIPDIIIKLADRDIIGQLIKSSKTTKLSSDCLGIQPATVIYCSDHLTPYTKRILAYAKELRRNGMVKYVWTKECVVYVRKEDQSPAIKIPDEITLNKVLGFYSKMDQEAEDPDGAIGTGIDTPAVKETRNTVPTPSKKRSIQERSPNGGTRNQLDLQQFKKPTRNFGQRSYQSKLENFRAPTQK